MEVSERDMQQAEANMQALRAAGHAVSARYDAQLGRVSVRLHNGLHFSFPAEFAEGLAGAAQEDLAVIEISPAGLGLHWPRLDADLYIPSLLQGIYGTPRWMAHLAQCHAYERDTARAA